MDKVEKDPPPRRRKFLTIPQFAEKLGLSERKVWREIEEGRIKVHRFGNSTRISDDDGDDYIRGSRE